MVEQNEGHKRAQSTLWTWQELNAAFEVAHCLVDQQVTSPPPEFNGVQVDSRLIKPGDLFIALAGDPGVRFQTSSRSTADGHDYVSAAMQAGAHGCVVAHPSDSQTTYIQVTDTYDGLWALGTAAGQRMACPKIAITGSSGKTTAKTMLKAALAGYASPGSFNNHIGVPLSLANAPVNGNPAVFEIGTSYPGEIEPLAQMVKPDVAMVVNVGSAHAENFSRPEDLYKEKISIFNALANKSNAVWEYSLDLKTGLSFGQDERADVVLRSLSGDMAQISVCGRTVSARVPGGGVHRALTLCGVLACCVLLDVSLDAAVELGAEAVPEGRGNEIEAGQVVIIDDSYNANPDSMARAVDVFLERGDDNRLLILGEMLELGDVSAGAHAEIAARLRGEKVILIGSGFEAAARELGLDWQLEADEGLLDHIAATCVSPYTILVKGSNRVFWQRQFVKKLAARLSN